MHVLVCFFRTVAFLAQPTLLAPYPRPRKFSKMPEEAQSKKRTFRKCAYQGIGPDK